MNTIVTKFGGSSLADAAQFRKAADILRGDPQRRFAVASAPGKRADHDAKVTDMLYECYDLAASGGAWSELLDRIRGRYTDIIRALIPSFSLDSEFAAIAEHLKASPDRDYVASRGEYLNARILAAYLGWDFVDAADVISFSENRTLDEANTKQKIYAALASREHAVIPGFYGAMPDHRVVTFSRGGSDITGSLVAWGIDADAYENWTDVSGMLFTDPRIVKDPIGIERITYRELRELSYMGATVLHEDAVFPVRRAGIPIHILNTNCPADCGTWIVADILQNRRARPVTGIAGKRGFCSILVEKSLMNGEIGFGAKLLSIFAENGICFEHCPTGIDTMSVLVNEAEFEPKRQIILEQVRDRLCPDGITVQGNLAMIAVVGQGMAAFVDCAARIFASLSDAEIPIRMIDQGSGGLNIIIGVDENDFEAAIRRLYAAFV